MLFRSKKQRLHLWRSNYVQSIVETKAHRLGIRISRVCVDVIKTADYIIDLGPEGGDGGGTIVATGTPEEVAENPDSFTGQYLKQALNGWQNI